MSQKIIDAVRNCHYTQLLLFMRHNYNFKIKTLPDCYNILMISLQIQDIKKRYKMFEYLLKHELVDLLETDRYGHDIFFACVLRECEKELELLMKNFNLEVDWNKMDHSGKTLLHYAVINNNLNILEILLTYCSKYKINIDIPDRVNKITPYLLACRLNFSKAADLLANLGHASKNQADQEAFYDAEQWKQEGQLERVKNFLKIKEEEINIAKLNGNVRMFKELSTLSQKLDNECDKNSDILPIIAKVIIDHDAKDKSLNFYKSSKSPFYNHIPLIKTAKSAEFSDPIHFFSRSNTNYFKKQNPNNNRHKFNDSAASSYSSSSVTTISSASSSGCSNYYKRSNALSPQELSQSTPVLPQNINTTLRQTMNNFLNKKGNNPPQMNSLLEMTNGQTSVDHFVGSKSETDINHDSRSLSSNNISRNSTTQNNQNDNKHHHGNHIHHHHHHPNNTLQNFEISQMFMAASMQNTGNYRNTVKYVPDQAVFQKKEIKTKSKPKHNLSSFKLITIHEESRLSSMSRKPKLSKIKS